MRAEILPVLFTTVSPAPCTGSGCTDAAQEIIVLGAALNPTELSLYCYSTLLANPFSSWPPWGRKSFLPLIRVLYTCLKLTLASLPPQDTLKGGSREALGRLLWPWLILTILSLHGTQSISLQICIADSHDILQIMAYWQSRDGWPILCPMIKSFPAQTTSSAYLTRFPGWLKCKYPCWWTFFPFFFFLNNFHI